MTRKHTPGPWFFDTNLHIYGTSAPQPLGGWPGGTTTEHPHVCTAKTVGDARLIAAAPELLAALERAETAMGICSDWMTEIEMPDGWTTTTDERLKVRAAIARATGSAA